MKGKRAMGRNQKKSKRTPSTKDLTLGTVYNPPLTPMRVNTGIWRRAIVSFEANITTKTRYAIKYGELRAKLDEMYGLDSTKSFEYSLDNARIYVIPSQATPGCSLTYKFMSLQDPVSILKSGLCESVQDQPARVGFKWPLAARIDPYFSETDREVLAFAFDMVGSSDNSSRAIVQVMLHYAYASADAMYNLPSGSFTIPGPEPANSEFGNWDDGLDDTSESHLSSIFSDKDT